jgi:cation diffusion facilitator CzcD-associated flavoprotein CzcO
MELQDNTYPGCGSDVPGHWYSLSSELNADWSAYYVAQPEIREYWERIYLKHNLQHYTVLNTAVSSAEWNTSQQAYHVTLKNIISGEEMSTDAEIIIWAIGGLATPRYPEDIPGTEKFKGHVWHSARWRHDIKLKGKKVAVIGNGCSAAQFIPEISEDPSVDVINFCRTPQWFFPRVSDSSFHSMHQEFIAPAF